MMYADFQKAARESRTQKAISEPIKAKIAGRSDLINIRIVKPLYGDAYAVYGTAPGIVVVGFKVSVRDVDNVKRWESF